MLLKCSECGGVVSNKAIACPHCGAPVEISRSISTEIPVSKQNVAAHETIPAQTEAFSTKESGCGDDQVRGASNEAADREQKHYDDSLAILVYFFEFVIAVAWFGMSCLISTILIAFLGHFFEAYELRQLISFALSPIYFVWPIEWMICKWNTFRAGHIVGNILLAISVCFVAVMIFGEGIMRSRTQDSWASESSFLPIIPVIVLFASIGIVISNRKNDSKHTSIESEKKILDRLDASLCQTMDGLTDDERTRLAFDVKGCAYSVVVYHLLYVANGMAADKREIEFNRRFQEVVNGIKKVGSELLDDSFRYFVGLFLPQQRYRDIKQCGDIELVRIMPELTESLLARNQLLSNAQLREVLQCVLKEAQEVAAEMDSEWRQSLAGCADLEFVVEQCLNSLNS